MKIILNGKIQDINFWSFLKMHILSQLFLLGIVYALIGFLTAILL